MIHVGVVDDDALVRRVLTTLLNTQDDISVTWAATDGDEALNHLNSSNQPDVEAVLLDIQMPHMVGTEFPQTATLILTTFTDKQLVDEALAVGVNGFIAKEDSIESIAGAIRQAVDGNIILSPKSGQHFRTTPSSTHIDHTTCDLDAQNKMQPSRSYTEFEYLSSREIEVLRLMVEALSNKQIARKLNISEATVKTHVSTLIAKLSVQDRVGAVVKAIRGGLA